jgi:tetratricopeptide (TPR) repeat protein
MRDDGQGVPGEPVAIARKTQGNLLGFSLEFREGIALVSLSDRKFKDRIQVERLSLEVPDVSFPFDVSGGAEQFRHHRCRLRTVVMSVSQNDLTSVLVEHLDPAGYGIENIRVRIEGGQGLIRGDWRVGEVSAPFIARFLAEAGTDLSLRLGFFDIRVFGFISLPAHTLVAQIGRALRSYRAEFKDVSFLMFQPVRDLMRWLLPNHGWKIPDLEGMRVDRVEMEDGRIRLISARYPDELAEVAGESGAATQSRSFLERQYLIFKEGADAYHNAELALHEGRLEDARKLYLGKAGVEPAHPHAARRMLEIGTVRPERFDEVEDLVRDLLEKDADFLPALLARAVLEGRGRDKSAGKTYEQIGRLCADRGERDDAVIAHLKAGSLLRESDSEKAILNYERVLELDPDHLRAMHTLTELYETQSMWYRALRINLKLAGRLEEAGAIASCHVRMGRIFLDRFDDLDRARKHLDAALTHDPKNLDALAAQAGVQKRRDQPTRAAKLLNRLIELAEPRKDEQLLLDARLRLADLWEQELEDPESALLHYQRILDNYPDHLHSLFKVGSLAAGQERWDQASTAFCRLLELEASGRPLPADVLKSACLAMGRIYMSRPGGSQEARSFLMRAAGMERDDLFVLLELEKINREEQAWTDLVDILERKARLHDEPEDVLAAILEAARLSDRQMGDLQRAERLYHQALELRSSSAEAVDGLILLLRNGKRYSELADLLVSAASNETDPKVAASLWAQVGEIRAENLDDQDGSKQALQLAVDLDPSNRSNVERLLAFYREREQHDKIVELIGQLEEDDWEDQELVNLWLERAQVLHEKLDDQTGAIESYQRAQGIDPGQLQAHRALADLYMQTGAWLQAREAILKVLDCAGEGGLSGPGRTELHRKLAAVELALGNREEAIAQHRAVLTRYEDDEESAKQLGRLLREDEKWDELAAFYARCAEQKEGEEAATLHTAAAAIWWEKLSTLEPAANQYQAAVDAAPESEATAARLASLQRVYAGLGSWPQVSAVIRRRISLAESKQKAPLLLALAAILGFRQDDKAGAAECWQQALESDPDCRPALLLLSRRRFEDEHFEDALELGERAISPDLPGPQLPVEIRAKVALDTARAAWALERLDDASRLYLLHLESFAPRQFAGVNSEAFERLELLLRKRQQYEDLALLYQRWLTSGATAEREGGVRRALGLLLFEHLDQPDEAVEVLSNHIHKHPEDQPAVSDFLDMLRKSARWEKLAQLLEDHWRKAPREKEKIRRLEELADVYQMRLHQPEAAIAKWRDLMELGYEPAAERLVGIYRQEEMFAELAELLKLRAEGAVDRQEALLTFVELGRVARDELENREAALKAFLQVYSIDPSEENQEVVLQLLRDMGDPEALGEFLGTSAQEEAADRPGRRKQLLLEHADLCIAKMEQTEEGLALIRQAIEVEPEEPVVNRAQTLYEQLGDWEGAADMQEILVDLAKDESTAARRVHRLGRLFLDHLDAPERAAAAFERAALLQPGWAIPLIDLAGIFERLDDFERLLAMKLRICETIEAAEEQSEHLHEAAVLAFDRLEDSEQGVLLLEKAVATATDPTGLLKELADRCEGLGLLKKAADALDHMVSESGEIAEAAETPASLLRRIADLRRRAGEEEAALAAYELVLQQEPSDEDSVLQLESIYRSQERFNDLALMFESLAGRKPEQQAVDAWLQAAKAWLDASEAKAAEADLQRALAIQPDHDEATILLLRLLAQRRAWPESLTLLEGLPGELFDQENVHSAAGSCFLGVLENPKDAAQELLACRVMLRVDPDHKDALQRSAQLLQESGEAQEAEEVLRKLDALEDRLDAGERYRLDLQLADIDFSRGRTEEAEKRLKRCVEAQPEDPEPKAFLHKLYAGGRRFADRVGLLLQEAEQASTQVERFEHLQSAAEQMEVELGDPEGAAALYRQVVDADAENQRAWEKLSELYRLLDNPESQREALLRLAELKPKDEQTTPMRKAARLAHDVLQDRQAARAGWTDLIERLPDDEEALDRLLILDRLEGAFDDLETHLLKKASLTDDPAVLAPLLRERAGILVEELIRPEDAVLVFERLRDLQPRDAEVFGQLAPLYEQLGRWPRLAENLQEQVELAGSERERAQLWSRLAGIREEHLDDRAGAVGALRKAIALDPEDVKPLVHLRELAVDDGDDVLLIEALEALASRASRAFDPQEEHDLRRSVGLLKWSLGQKDEARRSFLRALSLDEDDVVSRRFLAEILFDEDPVACTPHIRWLLAHPEMLIPKDLYGLKRMLVDTQKDADAATRIEAIEDLLKYVQDDLDAARQLSELYQETGNQKALADLLARMSELEAEEGKASLWIRRAEILDHEGDQSLACEAFARALQLPGDHRYEVALRLAKIQLHDIKDAGAAAGSLEKALEIRPGDPTILQMLSDVCWSLGWWEQAGAATQQLVGLPEGAEKPGLLLRLGNIRLREGDLEKAREAFQRTIVLDPACREAYQRVEEVLKAQPDDKCLAEFYLSWATSPAAGSRRIGLYLAAARHLQRIDAIAEAIGALRRALKLDSSNVEVFEALAPLLAREGEWEELLGILAQRRDLADDPERRLALGFEMGEVCKEHLQDLSRAAIHFEECLKIDPDHTGPLEELADIRYAEKG